MQVQEVHAPDEGPFARVRSHEDQRNIYAENLAPDLEVWRGRNLTMAHWAKNPVQQSPSTNRVFLIRNNTLYLPFQKKSATVCERPCNHFLNMVNIVLRKWLRQIKFPDVVWYMNVGDVSACWHTRCDH